MRDNHNYDLSASQNGGQPAGQFWNASLAFQDHSFTWEQVLRVLRKHMRFALIICCSLMTLTAIYLVMLKNFYKPTARLEIAPPDSGINTLHEIETPPEVENQNYLETQVQILGSDALAVSVIRELRLVDYPEFVGDKKLKEESTAGASSMTRSAVPGELVILLEQLDLATLTPAESRALEAFRRKLTVSSVRNTRLVELSFSSNDPQLSQLVTNTLVTKFIDQNYKNRYTTTMQASEWLSTQLGDLRKKMQESGQAVAEYQKQHGLVEVDDHDLPMSQLMGEMNRQLSDAQANRIEDEAFVRMIEDGHADAVPTLRDDKLFQDLMSRYVDLRTQLAQAKAVYGDANINVKKLQDQLVEVSVQIDAERKRDVGRVRSTYTSAKHREQLMTAERDKLREKMSDMSSELAAYHMLKTEANANVDLYNTLQGRLREAGIYAGLRSSNIRVVDLAQNLGKPSGPHRLVLFMLGAFGSCIFAVVLSFLREGIRNTVRTPDDVRSWVGLPSLALLPQIKATQHVPALAPRITPRFSDAWEIPANGIGKTPVEIMKAATAESEAMRDLRTALLYGKKGNAPRVILISSSMEGEGKTTVAVNFSIALAQIGNTCLIEGDLRQPCVAHAFKIESRAGLVDVLRGSIALADAVVDVPDVERLSILPCGTPSQSPADVLSSSRLLGLLDTLKKHYSFVVIDSPPVIPFSDARFLSGLADEVVLVGRYGVTTRRCMQRTAELLSEVQASVAGVVLNGIDLSSPDYDYYTYGYSRWRGKKARELQATGAVPPTGTGPDTPGKMSAHA